MKTDIRKVSISTDQGDFTLGLTNIILQSGEELTVNFRQEDDMWIISGHIERGFVHWLRRRLKI